MHAYYKHESSGFDVDYRDYVIVKILQLQLVNHCVLLFNLKYWRLQLSVAG